MKKHEILFSAIKLPLDFLIVFFSFFLARNLRSANDFIPGVALPSQTIDNSALLPFAFFGALLFVLIFSFHKLYFIKITSSKASEFLNIVRYSFYWFIFFSFFLFALKGIVYTTEIPRLVVGYSFLFATFFTLLSRIIANACYYKLMDKGVISKKKLLLITNKKNIDDILADIHAARVYEIVGYTNSEEKKLSLPFLTETALQKLFETKKIDEVLYIDSDFSKNTLHEIWELTRIFGVRYRYITNSFEVSKTNTSLSLINTIPAVEINTTSLNAWAKIFKRIFDFFAGVFGILITAPIMLIIAFLIKLEDPSGPVIYKNLRIGQDGKLFHLYKFRYMKWKYCTKEAYGLDDDAAETFEKELIKTSSKRHGPLYKIENDPRKTKVGAFIEKYSLDETAQFFNLVLGNMSLVGPRPHQPREVQKYSLDQKRLLTIKPGITGMAQVNGRENNDFEKEAKLDIFYIENWSALLDLKIILKTFGVLRVKK